MMMIAASRFFLSLVATSLCLPRVSDLFVRGFATVRTSPQPPRCHGQQQQQQQQQRRRRRGRGYGSRIIAEDLRESSVDSERGADDDVTSSSSSLKRDLLQLGASYDRGYGATKRARDQVDALISRLEAVNPEPNAVRGIDGSGISPLTGSWRMVWTTAPDVLTLSASPLVTVGAIYQVFDLPRVTNVIDFLPPFQTLVGDRLGSLLRAKVTTRAYRGKNDEAVSSNRIGLDFESVALEPVEFLGGDVGFLPPLGFDLPRTPFEGFFDVAFLDDELLIVRQNAPGGIFVLAKVENFDP